MATSKGSAHAHGYAPKGFGAHGGHHAFKHTAPDATDPQSGDHMINPMNAAARAGQHTPMDGGMGQLPS